MRKINIGKKKGRIDGRLLVLALALTALGLVIIADASAPQALNSFGDKYYFVKQQGIWALVGVVAMLAIANLHYSIWEKVALPLFGVSVLLLIAVLIPGIGVSVLGARRWIDLGFTTIQPSEIVKLALAVYIATLASKGKDTLAYIVPIGLVSLLIMLEPDLGTTIIVASIGLAQIFVAGVNLLHITGIVLAGGAASFALIMLSDYRKARLMTFIESTGDPLGTSYHIRQVLFALGLGGLFGVGLGQSRQKYLFLPEAATDSIFAIIAEEVGFVGASILIFILALFVFRALTIASRAPDTFSKVLAVGLTTWIGGQILMNIAAMVSLVPLTGIPLPFLSYGGSALTMILLATGILLNISKYGVKRKEKIRKR